jgi:hypothetical protein
MNTKLAVGLLIAIAACVAVVMLRSKPTSAATPVVATPATAPPPAVPPPSLDGLPREDRSPATQDAPKPPEETASTPAAPPKPDAQSDRARVIEEGDRKWKAKYEGMSVAELEAARDLIEASVDEQSRPILVRMLKAGQSTLVSTDPKGPTLTSADNQEISMFQMQRGVGTFRTTLPHEEYPELYELRQEDIWISTVAIPRLLVAETPTKK